MDSRNRAIAALRDSDWVRKKHLLSQDDLDTEVLRWRTFSSAHMKYTNASLGGNFPINQVPAFTRFADVRSAGTSFDNHKTKYTHRHGRKMLGPGRYWSEAFDDNRVEVHMRFGTPRYNGLATFFMNFYSHGAGLLAREGRASISYYIGLGIGSILAIPATAFIFVGKVISFLMGRPSSRYYYMVQAMPLYWNRVNFIVNQIQVKRHIAPQKISGILDKRSPLPQEDWGFPDTDDYVKSAAKNFPIFRADGTIDAYNVGRGAQALANEQKRRIENALMTANSREEIRKRMTAFINETTPSGFSIRGDIGDYLKRYHGSVQGDTENRQKDLITDAEDAKLAGSDLADLKPPVTDSQTVGTADEAQTTPPGPSTSEIAGNANFQTKLVTKDDGSPSWIPGIAMKLFDKVTDGVGKGSEMLEADLKEGGQYVTFRVDSNSITEGFNNQTSPPEIESRLNGLSKSAAVARFSLSDGNTGFAPIDAIVKSARDFIAGNLDGMHLSGLVALAGNAYVDIPKDYDSSSTQWPTASYTIQLRAPYGNKYSQMMNLDFPLAMLLAAALPISTGKHSYTRPFLCEMYCRGRNQIRLGMIDQLLITRGVGNMGFNRWGQALGYDITFSIADLSTVMHAPIDSTFGPSGIGGPVGAVVDSAKKVVNTVAHFFDDENAFNDYLAVLASMSMADQIYLLRRLNIRLSSAALDLSSFFSMSHWSSEWANGETVQTLASIFTPDSPRIS